MKALAQMFDKVGCGSVCTYIQSGNVVFKSNAQQVQTLGKVISQKIQKTYQLDVPLLVRSAKELLRISKSNPFLKKGKTEDAVYMAFLAQTPPQCAIESLDPERSAGDAFEIVGREIFLYCPNGLARTKLSNQYFDSKLSTISTIHNWKTILKLVEMAQRLS